MGTRSQQPRLPTSQPNWEFPEMEKPAWRFGSRASRQWHTRLQLCKRCAASARRRSFVRSFRLIVCHAHRAQELSPAWIFAEVDQKPVAFRPQQARVALLARSLQPFERLIFLSTVCMDLGDLVRRAIGETFLQPGQGRV